MQRAASARTCCAACARSSSRRRSASPAPAAAVLPASSAAAAPSCCCCCAAPAARSAASVSASLAALRRSASRVACADVWQSETAHHSSAWNTSAALARVHAALHRAAHVCVHATHHAPADSCQAQPASVSPPHLLQRARHPAEVWQLRYLQQLLRLLRLHMLPGTGRLGGREKGSCRTRGAVQRLQRRRRRLRSAATACGRWRRRGARQQPRMLPA